MAHTIGLPIKGMYLIHESFHAGGVVPLAINFPRELFAGTLISEDSGIMVLGQSSDQSTVFGGRALSRRRFWRCSRKMGTLPIPVSIPDAMITLPSSPRAIRMGVYLLVREHRFRLGEVQHSQASQEPSP